MTRRLRMDAEAAEEVRSGFAATRDLLTLAEMDVGPLSDRLSSACGELAGELGDGPDTFTLGWRQVLDTCGTASRLIVTNVNELRLELTTIDEDAARTLLGPGRI